jgi:3-hydroxyisobutyrate dehydrogenase-like beta-hydroxyacid dehydrogenase
MRARSVGVIHPGAMGVTVALAARSTGSGVLCTSEGRSGETLDRANAAGLVVMSTLAEVVNESDVLISVCPPSAALALAQAVSDLGFSGTYLDANAVAPTTMRAVSELFGDFVDGGIVGPPATRPATTRLFLSGENAAKVGSIFQESNLEPVVLDAGAGAASALKMCYAAWTKGTSAMLLAIRALATFEGVDEALLVEWARSQPGLVGRAEAMAPAVSAKAWRFSGEMAEIASTFSAAGLPADFHVGAADIYDRLASLKLTGDQLSGVIELLLER